MVYNADDSIVIDVEKKVIYLFGNAQLDYKTTTLNAYYIELQMDNKTLFAKGTLDTNGKYIDKPFFKDGEQGFASDSLKYNFDTEKGKIYKAKTQEGDGYIHAKQIKKVDEDVLYLKNGLYTTCEHDTPHFYIAANKMKVIKDDKIVTGPANLKVADAPTPLVVPFGIFPNKRERTSGIVLPQQYGQSPNQGLFLNRFGYYWAISDYLDATFTGDIYSLGSWATYFDGNYKKRYKFDGSLDLEYSVFKTGFKELPDYSETRNFKIRWRHSQDPKANPKFKFTGDVTAGSGSVFRNNISTTTEQVLTNNFVSNINATRTFKINFLKTTASLAAAGRHEQNVLDSSITLKIPDLAFNVSRFFPFKTNNNVGDKFYENIGMQFSSNFVNQLDTKLDSTFFSLETLDKFQKALRYSVPITYSGKFLNYFTFNPSIRYNGVSKFETYEQTWDTINNVLTRDTIDGFKSFHDIVFSTNVTTKIYGMYDFGSKSAIRAVRHTITPNIGVNFSPDISKPQYGYFKEYIRYDNENIPVDTVQYSIFQGLYGSPRNSAAFNITFGAVNQIEMKVKDKTDSTGRKSKKITLIDNLRINSSYNMLADSLNLNPFSFNGNFKLFQNFNINFNGTLDPYQIDFYSRQRINQFEIESWKDNKRIARLTSLNTSLSLSLRGKSDAKTTSTEGTEEELKHIQQHPEQYIDFTIPWSLNISYNIYYTKPLYNPTITNSLKFGGDLRLTPSWKIRLDVFYDLETYQFALPTINIYRDLHCWELKFRVIPSGSRQSYSFDLNVKAPILQDLKLTRRLEWYDQ